MPVVVPLLVLAAVEVWLVVLVAGAIGALWTVALLLAGSALGGWLLRREGAKAFRALQEAVLARRAPHREVADGGLVFVGGLLMLVPGFASDVLGLLCLLPPTRAVLRRVLLGYAARRVPATIRRAGAATEDPGRQRDPGDFGRRTADPGDFGRRTAEGGSPAHPVIDGEAVPPGTA